MLKVSYNAPVVLTLSLAALAVVVVETLLPGATGHLFTAPAAVDFGNPLHYLRLLTHVLGHAGWSHLAGNLTFLLLLGPLLEEKYGSPRLLLLIAVTALATGAVNAALFHTRLLGASGVVFMLITLASLVDIRRGYLPLTFVLVAVVFLGREGVQLLRADGVAQSAHLVGGAVGAAFGFGLGGRGLSRTR